MSNESMDERFGSEFISQCCQILSSNYSREGEDEADHPLMHTPEGRKDSGTPLSVTPRPPSPKPAQQFPLLSSTGYRRSPSLDRNEEADLAELIQHQDARKVSNTMFVSERSQKKLLHSQPYDIREIHSKTVWGNTVYLNIGAAKGHIPQANYWDETTQAVSTTTY